MRRFLAMSLAVFTLAACSGGGDDGGTAPTTGSIALSASTSSLTIARGASATVNVTVARTNYTGAVTLTAGGAPTGVNVAFAPASLTGSANLAVATISADGTAAAGTYTINITGSGTGVSSASTAVTVVITAPSITLTAGANAATAVQGQTATVPLTITRSGGFTGDVTLTASGVPTGATATFAPATLSGTATASTLSLAAGTAAAGTYTITVTAAGAGLTAQTATIALTVTAAQTPTVSVTAAPAALTVEAAQTGNSTITITRGGGFTGAVNLAVQNAPAGVTATFTPTSIATGSTTSALALAVAANVLPGLYNFTVQATGTGVTAATTAIALTVTAAPSIGITAIANQSLSQGTSTANAIPIVLTRTGTVGNATMTLEGAPAGVTAAFAANPVGAGTTMTLSAAANTQPGTYTLTLRATAGTVTSTTTFSLTVTAAAQGSFAISAVPSAGTVAQGQTVLTTINIARAGGFTGGVTLTASGLPNGATATFVPAVATGAQAQLGIDVGSGVQPGAYTITVRGTGAGVADQTITYALTVTQSGNPGGNGTWTFCDPARFPLWFAVQNGVNGAWTAVTPTGTTNRVYNFTVTNVGGVAFALQAQGRTGVDVTLYYMTAAELGNTGGRECTTNPGGKALTGTVAGLSGPPTSLVPQSASIGYGNAMASVTAPTTTFNLTNAPLGTTDLLAFRTVFSLATTSFAPDRGVLRRNVNYVGAIPVIDFAGAESFAVATAPYTFANTGSDTLLVSQLFETANGNAGSFAFALQATSPVTLYGVPSNLLQAGDLHGVLASAMSGNQNAQSIRILYQYNQTLAPRTLTFGSAAPTPTITSTTSPYVRYSTTGAWPAEYGDAMGLTFYQVSTTSNTWTYSMTRAYTSNAGSFTLDTPNFTGVGNFNPSWAMAPGSTNWSFTVIGSITGQNPVTGRFSDGANWKAASRTGVVTP
ncbi:MAG: hypothetical protein LCH84_16650 [Gemmatimonadetes bacterium]|nr:hypothetical protein [Gemmatimonadota bacterium]